MKTKQLPIIAAVIAVVVSASADQRLYTWFHNRSSLVTYIEYNGTSLEAEPAPIQYDGTHNFSFYGIYNVTPAFEFDFGARRKLSRMVVGPSQNTTYWQVDRGKGVAFEVSVDGENWELAYITPTDTGYAGTSPYDVDLSGLEGRYRYARLRATGGLNSCGTLIFYTDEPSIRLQPIRTWGMSSPSARAEESSDGPRAIGEILAPEGTSGTIRAFASPTDFDDNYSVWLSNARSFGGETISVQEGAAKADYNIQMSGLEPGHYFVRTFFIVGDNAYSCEATRPLVVGAKPAPTLTAYVSGFTRSGATNLGPAGWFNGTVESSRASEVASNYNIKNIFDIKDITDAGRYVSAVRIWKNRGCDYRAVAARIYLGYEDSDNPAEWTTPEAVLDEETRKVFYASTVPDSIIWTESPVTCAYDFFYYSVDLPVFEIPLPADKAFAKREINGKKVLPRYVMISNIAANDVVEIEVRTSKIPSTSLKIMFL